MTMPADTLPWHRVTDALPDDGTWCWVWHTDWDVGPDPPLLTCYCRMEQRDGTVIHAWWFGERRFTLDDITHWCHAVIPTPPGPAGTAC